MEKNLSKSNWFSHILKIAIPVSLQSLLASSLSVIDQIMVGSLGETDIASVSLAGRFPTVFFFSVGSITVAASILISQFRGKADKEQISRAFLLMFRWGLLLTALFFAVSYFFAAPLMTLFSPDLSVQTTGSDYLRIVTLGFLPGFASGMFSTYLRTTGRPGLPTIASVFAMVSNTILNYILIFGHLGFSAMGVHGAAIATTIARLLEFGLVLFFFLMHMRNSEWTVQWKVTIHGAFRKMAIIMALPIFLSELAWSMGEAIYGIVYGHIGTDETAAMSLIGPMVIMSMGLFAGVAQASGILVGGELGKKDYDMGVFLAKKAMKIGLIGAVGLGIVMIAFAGIYPNLYAIADATKHTTTALLITFSAVMWIKVSNMILGGILKSGGKTHYVFFLDLLGTWVIGIPLGLLSAFVFELPIYWVYLLIATEELVRLLIGYRIFLSRKWIQTIA